MAGDWIKMRADLFTHPKVVRMASALKVDNLRTVGGLMSAWCLFDAHSVDGKLDGYTVETLDTHLRWPGFSEAMKAVGWLEVEPESLALPRFDTHNGESAKRRAQDTERKRSVRKLSASQPDKSRTREEKRREEAIELPTHTEGTIGSASGDSACADAVGSFEGRPPEATHTATDRGRARVEASTAIRAAGCEDVSASNAHLVSALRDGLTVAELVDLARLHPGKSIAYLCKKARGLRADAAVGSGAVSKSALSRNPEGPSPRLSREEEKRRQADALAAMREQYPEMANAH